MGKVNSSVTDDAPPSYTYAWRPLALFVVVTPRLRDSSAAMYCGASSDCCVALASLASATCTTHVAFVQAASSCVAAFTTYASTCCCSFKCCAASRSATRLAYVSSFSIAFRFLHSSLSDLWFWCCFAASSFEFFISCTAAMYCSDARMSDLEKLIIGSFFFDSILAVIVGSVRNVVMELGSLLERSMSVASLQLSWSQGSTLIKKCCVLELGSYTRSERIWVACACSSLLWPGLSIWSVPGLWLVQPSACTCASVSSPNAQPSLQKNRG